MCTEKTWSRRGPGSRRPNFDQEKRRDQAHFVEQKPENEILCRECAVERGLHYEHGRTEPADAAWSRSGKKCEWNDERREQEEQQTQPIDSNQIFSVDRRNPRMMLNELQACRSGIKLSP